MNIYNHTRKLFNNGEITLANLTVMLVSSSYTFSAAETAITTAETNEVDGGGWTTGGEAIANPTITVTSTNEMTLDGDDISVTATGANIGPARGLVIYHADGTGDEPLFHYDFGENLTANDGTDFDVTWNANGIHVSGDPA